MFGISKRSANEIKAERAGSFRISRQSYANWLAQRVLLRAALLQKWALTTAFVSLSIGIPFAVYLGSTPLEDLSQSSLADPQDASAQKRGDQELTAHSLQDLMTAWTSPAQVGEHLRILGCNERPDAVLPRQWLVQIEGQLSLLTEGAPLALVQQMNGKWARSDRAVHPDALLQLTSRGSFKAFLCPFAQIGEPKCGCSLPIESNRRPPCDASALDAWQINSPTCYCSASRLSATGHLSTARGAVLHFCPDPSKAPDSCDYHWPLGIGEYLIWKAGRWRPAGPAEDTSSAPLISLESIRSDRLTLRLWDQHGLQHPIHLKLSYESLNDQCLQHLQLIGARNQSTFTLQIASERQVLELGQALICEDGRWRVKSARGNCPSDRFERGQTLQFEALVWRRGRWVLRGTLTSPGQSIAAAIELSQQWPGRPARPNCDRQTLGDKSR